MSLAIDVLEPSALLIVCQVLDGALLTRLRGVKPGIGGAVNVRFCLKSWRSHFASITPYSGYTRPVCGCTACLCFYGLTVLRANLYNAGFLLPARCRPSR